MVVLILLLAFIIVAVFSWAYCLIDAKRLGIAGPFPLPILGNALMFIGDAAHFVTALSNIHAKYGGAVRIHMITTRYIVLAHPKYVGPVCSSTELITKGKSYDYMKPWLGEGLLTSSGRIWNENRKLLTPAFHFNVLQTFLPVFCKNGKILNKKLFSLANGQAFDLFPVIALAALDNITESIMGVSINAQKDNHSVHSNFVKAVKDISVIASERMRNPILGNDFCSNLFYKQRQDKILGVLYGQTNKMIADRKEKLERNGFYNLSSESEPGIKNKQTFLDLLLHCLKEGKIDDLAVREEVNTFLFGGLDSTTSGMVFCLRCISKHDEVQNKLLQEQKRIFGDDFNRDITISDLHQMQYLELVIRETLRLYPSVPFIERYTTKDTKICELLVPKDTAVVLNILYMQRNPDVHADPLKFRPERFESGENKPFDWMPFSAGPRNCLGQKFAMMEMKVTISAIIRNFKLVPSDKEPVLCVDLVLRSKNGVHVGFLPRN